MITNEEVCLYLCFKYECELLFDVKEEDFKSQISIPMLEYGSVKSVRFEKNKKPPRFGWLSFADEESEAAVERVLRGCPKDSRAFKILDGRVTVTARKNKNSPMYMKKKADQVVVNISCNQIDVGYLTKSIEPQTNVFRPISSVANPSLPYPYLKISRKGKRVEWGLRKTSKGESGIDDIKFCIKFRMIKTLVIDAPSRTLYLGVNKTRFPSIFKRCKGTGDIHWRRETEIPVKAAQLLSQHPWLTPYLNVWGFQVSPQDKDFTKFLQELHDWKTNYAAPFRQVTIKIEPISPDRMQNVVWLVPFLMTVFIKSKRIVWAINCLISNAMIDLETLVGFIQFIATVDQHDSESIDRTTKSLNGMNNDDQVHPHEDPIYVFNRMTQSYIPKKRNYTDNKYQYVFSVWITPTKQIAVRERYELSNRVRRKHHEYHDRFLRVSFVEEDTEMVNISSCSALFAATQSKLEARIDDIIHKGITFPGLDTFQMLAFSSSQLREKSCWFYSDTPDLTIAAIHNQMGNFSQEKIPAKYAARMGQCFSSTEEGVTLSEDNIIKVPDIPSRDPFPPFSDGVGEISSKLVKTLCKRLRFKDSPSAAQIRFAGYKGVVAIESPTRWTCCKCTLVNDKNKSQSNSCVLCGSVPQDEYLKLRPSMNKFESDHYVLEILNVSKSLTGFLNSQIIIILSALGISDDIFLKYHRVMLNEMDAILTSETSARNFLRVKRSGYMMKVLRCMLKSNFKIQQESLLRHCLQAIHYSSMKDLRTRNRIMVPDSKLAMGVLDEIRVLDDQEVFFQTKDEQTKKYRVIEGWVVIAKNPALYPGDVRKFKAVDKRELHHLKDCVVFPQVGDRPHPNECSGSDLDGDLYFISWCPDLIFRRENYPAMFFDTQKSKIVKLEKVEFSHIKQFYVEYMKNDILGKVANYHVVWADQNGIFSTECERLAELHSIAVDFPKTGVPAVMPQALIPTKFPHCKPPGKKAQRRRTELYKSQKILGKLYDATPEPQLEKVKDPSKAPLSIDQDLVLEGFEQYTEEAKEKLEEYRGEMVRLMNQYGVGNETELVTGCSLTEKGRWKRGKWMEIMKEVGQLMEEVRERYYEEFKKNVEEKGEKRKKASAWYFTAYADNDNHHDDVTKSFGWIPYKVLCDIKKNP